uniref:BTB domain-containing protein n=1 Tax=Panagrolaimus davidi TaxID=227884 RepID=A0A914PVQ7_9BILA
MAQPTVKVKYPVDILWIIKEDSNLRNETKRGKKITTSYGLTYYLKLYPNGHGAETEGQTEFFLFLELGSHKNVVANISYSIETANWFDEWEFNYEKSVGKGTRCCKIEDFYDPTKKFFVNGNCVFKVKGSLTVNEETKISPKDDVISCKKQRLSEMLWEDSDNKDFAIFAKGKQIKVHKHIIAVYSPVFAGMFKSGMKEAKNGRVEIPNYSFEVVEIIVKLCYDLDISGNLIFDHRIELFKFVDQYLMDSIKEIIENYLIKKLSVINVCLLSNCSIAHEAENLKSHCSDLITKCLKDGTAVNDLDILDKDFKLKIFDNAFSFLA